jgi:hypothetical protein
MPELGEQIRDFIESGARPVTADEVLANVRAPVMRQPRGTARLGYRRFGMYMAVTLAAASVALIVGLAIAPAGVSHLHAEGLHASSARSALVRAATSAAVQPALVPTPGQFLYVRTLSGSIDFTASSPGKPLEQFYVQELNQEWSTPAAVSTHSSEVVGVPRFVTGADRNAWRAAGAKPLSSGVGGGVTPVDVDVADLPTDPSLVQAYLTRQPALSPRPSSGSDAAWLFTTALGYLQGGASSAQRSALLRFIDTIPGVYDGGPATTLGTNAAGTLLSIRSAAKESAVQAILDVATSQLLEVRTVDAPQGGHVQAYTDFLFAGITDTVHAAPPGAPPLPAVWPHGTTREPAPGSVYS